VSGKYWPHGDDYGPVPGSLLTPERPMVSGCFQTANTCRPTGEDWAGF
jgi:hypothetical protein